MPSNFKLQSKASCSLPTELLRTTKKDNTISTLQPARVEGAHDALSVRVLQQRQHWQRRQPYYYAMSNTTRHKPIPILLCLNILTLSSCCFVSCLSLTDSQILLNFRESLSNPIALANWDGNIPPCNVDAANWNGVICSNGEILGLQLEDMGLQGTVNINILNELKQLRIISLMRNNLEGPMPNVKQLGNGALKAVFLANNRFSGEISEDAFDGMASLKKLYLADNLFTGQIPQSLTRLPRLTKLRLEGNNFQGQIPDFHLTKFESFNLSRNALIGSIPRALRYLDPSSFSDNRDLCGAPLESCDILSPAPAPAPGPRPSTITNSNLIPLSNPNPNRDTATSSNSPPSPLTDDSGSNRSGSKVVIASVATASVVALAAIIAAIFVFRKRKREYPIEDPPPSNLPKKSRTRESGLSSPRSTDAVVGGKKPEIKLSFVRDDVERFDLNDLLRASAEVLGSGCFGSSYKASLATGVMMVVKRFKQMNNVGREEFTEHMRRLGRLRHPNLLPLVAYYYRKEEKLLVHEFVQRRSLSVHLHGRQALGQPSLDWPSRLKIIKGASKGLQYLYKELPSLIAPHGHIKSSNVLLNESFEPLLADYGLIPVMNQESAHELMVAYKSPEFLHHSRVTKKTDVWGLGILILETLTGKFPSNFLQQGKKAEEDLATWVKSILANNGGVNQSEVFDKDMGDSTRNGDGEMMKLLKIGLACSEEDMEKRLDLKEAVEKIEEVKERDNDDDFYSSYASEADFRSSRGKSDDFPTLKIISSP